MIDIIYNYTDQMIREHEVTYRKSTNEFEEKRKPAILDLMLDAKINQGTIDNEGIRDEINVIIFGVRSFILLITFIS